MLLYEKIWLWRLKYTFDKYTFKARRLLDDGWKKSEAVDDILEEEFSSKEVIENDFIKEAVSKPKIAKNVSCKIFFFLNQIFS